MSVTVRRRAVKIQRCLFKATVTIHLLQLQLVPQDKALGVQDRLLPGEHLADFHECFVFSLWDNEVDIDGHWEANSGKHQVAVCASWHLRDREDQLAESRNDIIMKEQWSFFGWHSNRIVSQKQNTLNCRFKIKVIKTKIQKSAPHSVRPKWNQILTWVERNYIFLPLFFTKWYILKLYHWSDLNCKYFKNNLYNKS